MTLCGQPKWVSLSFSRFPPPAFKVYCITTTAMHDIRTHPPPPAFGLTTTAMHDIEYTPMPLPLVNVPVQSHFATMYSNVFLQHEGLNTSIFVPPPSPTEPEHVQHKPSPTRFVGFVMVCIVGGGKTIGPSRTFHERRGYHYCGAIAWKKPRLRGSFEIRHTYTWYLIPGSYEVCILMD